MLLASLRADAGDAHAFVQALAAKLEDALPGQVTIERHGGLFSREKPVRRIELELGEHRYRITDQGHGRLEVERLRVVRGVTLKREDLTVDAWIAALTEELSDMAESSNRAREALERLLLGR